MIDVVTAKLRKFQGFAEEWLAAWNSHSIDAILSHYALDVIVKSPFIAAAVSGSHGSIEGTTKLRGIYSKALLKYPDLHFQALKILAGRKVWSSTTEAWRTCWRPKHFG